VASSVDICNLALAHLGDDATVSSLSPPDGGTQAEHCARFYPIARDALLEMHAWRFAVKRVALAEVTNDLDSWQYAYALPNGCLRPLSVLLPESTDDTATQDFVVETDANGTAIVYTNAEMATLRYISAVTDTTKFTPLFVTAFSWLLASYLAGPVTKDAKVKESAYKVAMAEFARAAAADSNAQKVSAYKDFTPGAISARA
jgi:hypothetical protein